VVAGTEGKLGGSTMSISSYQGTELKASNQFYKRFTYHPMQ